MPIIQPCQDAAPNYFEKFFEGIKVESPESLVSLDTNDLLNLLNNWYLYKNFLQTKSCNFTSSLFANIDMNEKTLRERKNTLELILRRIELLSTDSTINPEVIEYSKKLIGLAIADHYVWLDIKYCSIEGALANLPYLEKNAKEILPYRSEIYSLIKQRMDAVLALPGDKERVIVRTLPAGLVREHITHSWVRSLLCHNLQDINN